MKRSFLQKSVNQSAHSHGREAKEQMNADSTVTFKRRWTWMEKSSRFPKPISIKGTCHRNASRTRSYHGVCRRWRDSCCRNSYWIRRAGAVIDKDFASEKISRNHRCGFADRFDRCEQCVCQLPKTGSKETRNCYCFRNETIH